MRGTLVHSEYKFGTGFEIIKRPGLSVFLQRISRFYEIVVFGDEESAIINDICEALDPNYSMIAGRLGRESTLLKNGNYIKDLSYLNRPIKNILVVDFTDEKCEFHKENVLKIPHWNGDKDDRELYDLMPFLESLAMDPRVDVRRELDKYGRDNVGQKFKEVREAQRQMILQQREKGISGVFGSL
jgi:import inner membrane translocase subunit TIM50